MRKLYLLAIFVFVANTAFSQFSPTLSAGINQLTGSKGTIDVELLSDIVVSKQEELKKEVIKKFILNSTGNANFTIHNYTYNILDILLNEKNKNTITGKTIEYTSNLALIYAFAEYYLQTEWYTSKSDTTFIKVLNYLQTDFRYLSVAEQLKWFGNLSAPNHTFRPGLINNLKQSSKEELENKLNELNTNLKFLNSTNSDLEQNSLFTIAYPTNLEILILVKALHVFKKNYEQEFKDILQKNDTLKKYLDIDLCAGYRTIKPDKYDSMLIHNLIIPYKPVFQNWENFVNKINNVYSGEQVFSDLQTETENMFTTDSVLPLTYYEEILYHNSFVKSNLSDVLHKYNIYKSLVNKYDLYYPAKNNNTKNIKITGFLKTDTLRNIIGYDADETWYYKKLRFLNDSVEVLADKNKTCFGYIMNGDSVTDKENKVIAENKNGKYKILRDFYKELRARDPKDKNNWVLTPESVQFFRTEQDSVDNEMAITYRRINMLIDLILEQKEAIEASVETPGFLESYNKLIEQIKPEIKTDSNKITRFEANFDRLSVQLNEISNKQCITFFNVMEDLMVDIGIYMDNEYKKSLKNIPVNYNWIKKLTYYQIVESRLYERDAYYDIIKKLNNYLTDSVFIMQKSGYEKIRNGNDFFNFQNVIREYNDYIELHPLYMKFLLEKQQLTGLKDISHYHLTVPENKIDTIIEVKDFYYKLYIIQELKKSFENTLDKLNTKEKKNKLPEIDQITPFNLIFLDMIFDICKNNKTILYTGFFNLPISVSETEYAMQNRYLRLRKTDPLFFTKLQPLYQSLNTKITTLFEFYQLIKEMNLFKGANIENVKTKYRERLLVNLKDTTIIKHKKSLEINNKQKYIDSLVYLNEKLSLLTEDFLDEKFINDSIPVKYRYNELFRTIKTVLLIDSKNQDIVSEFEILADNFISELENLNLFKINLKTKEINEFLNLQTGFLNDLLIKESGLHENNIAKFKKSIELLNPRNLSENDQKVMVKIVTFLKLLEKNDADYLSFNYLAYMRDSVIPQLVIINAKYRNGKNETDKINTFDIDALENLINYGYYIQIEKFLKSDKKLTPEMIKYAEDFIEIISRLNQLNRVETYEYILKILADAGNVLSDKKGITSVNFLINSTLTNLQADTKNNLLNLDVESLILKIYDKYEKINHNHFAFYFSIGLNQTMFLPKATFNKGTESYTLDKFAFAAEKIGVKIIPCDRWNRQYMRQQNYEAGLPANGNPIINDYHFILYGSGLMYNVVNTTTNKNFKYSMLGAGWGITFYNSMDLNLTWSVPMTSNPFKHHMLGFSFDIKISEYLSALNKKRINGKNK